jgi:hypothetical protein
MSLGVGIVVLEKVDKFFLANVDVLEAILGNILDLGVLRATYKAADYISNIGAAWEVGSYQLKVRHIVEDEVTEGDPVATVILGVL